MRSLLVVCSCDTHTHTHRQTERTKQKETEGGRERRGRPTLSTAKAPASVPSRQSLFGCRLVA